MMYDDSTKTIAKIEPDFIALCNSLKLEITTAYEIAQGMNYLVSALKPMVIKDTNENLDVKEEPGIVGVLWSEIYKLRDINNRNYLTLNHIKEIVGS